MKCPKCVVTTTKVTDSRVSQDFKKDIGWSQWIRKAGAVFQWYSPDWRVRRRVCRNDQCDHVFITIEVSVEDLKEAFDYVKEN